MKVELRDPNIIMKLSRLGSFHQSKLSFKHKIVSASNILLQNMENEN